MLQKNSYHYLREWLHVHLPVHCARLRVYQWESLGILGMSRHVQLWMTQNESLSHTHTRAQENTVKGQSEHSPIKSHSELMTVWRPKAWWWHKTPVTSETQRGFTVFTCVFICFLFSAFSVSCTSWAEDWLLVWLTFLWTGGFCSHVLSVLCCCSSSLLPQYTHFQKLFKRTLSIKSL